MPLIFCIPKSVVSAYACKGGGRGEEAGISMFKGVGRLHTSGCPGHSTRIDALGDHQCLEAGQGQHDAEEMHVELFFIIIFFWGEKRNKKQMAAPALPTQRYS